MLEPDSIFAQSGDEAVLHIVLHLYLLAPIMREWTSKFPSRVGVALKYDYTLGDKKSAIG